ncbi:MAG: hypothetical protein ABR498_07050, partial [Candidatus Dormibacteria bacterium]
VHDIDDRDRPKDAALREHTSRAFNTSAHAYELETRLRIVLSRHDTPTGDLLDAPCIHGDEYGTVSSSSLIVRDGVPHYRHAAGRPCLTPFAPVRVLAGALRRVTGASTP